MAAISENGALFRPKLPLTFVFCASNDLFVGSLDLEQQFDTLNWGHSSLGDGSRHTSGKEILGKGHGIAKEWRISN